MVTNTIVGKMALAALVSGADAPLLYPVILVLAGTLTLIFSLATSGPKLHSSFPIAGLESGWFGRLEKARRSWLHRSKEIVNEGLTKFPGCFQVVTASGPKLVLPGEFADEIRNNPHLSFQQAVSKVCFTVMGNGLAWAQSVLTLPLEGILRHIARV